MWTKLPQWAKVLVVLAVLWIVYRVLLIWFQDPLQSFMALFGMGAGASMLAGNHKALRNKEKEDTAADKAELEANRKTINSHKEEIRLLNQQMQQIPLTVNEELKAELDNLADAKKQIADQEMTEAEAVNFLRQRLNQRRQG